MYYIPNRTDTTKIFHRSQGGPKWLPGPKSFNCQWCRPTLVLMIALRCLVQLGNVVIRMRLSSICTTSKHGKWAFNRVGNVS